LKTAASASSATAIDAGSATGTNSTLSGRLISRASARSAAGTADHATTTTSAADGLTTTTAASATSCRG
jgi:hypothetical protein